MARAEIAADQNSHFCTPQSKIIKDSAYAPNGYLRVRAFVFLAKGDRASGVAGTRPVLPDTGESFKFLSDIQAGEVPHRVNMRPCGPAGADRPLAACCLPARETAVTASLTAPSSPRAPARYGWCQNKEG